MLTTNRCALGLLSLKLGMRIATRAITRASRGRIQQRIAGVLAGLLCVALTTSCGGGGADSRDEALAANGEAQAVRAKAASVSSPSAAALTTVALAPAIVPAAASITPIAGYGTALHPNPDASCCQARVNGFPISNSGVAVINGIATSSDYLANYFDLTSDGITYSRVTGIAAPTGNVVLLQDGTAITGSNQLMFQQRTIVGTSTPTFQLFTRVAPYSEIRPYSAVFPDPSGYGVRDLYVNDSGQGVGWHGDPVVSGKLHPFRYDGLGESQQMNLGVDAQSFGPTKSKILADGSIYIAVQTLTLQTREIWRFPPGDTQNHSVVYQKLVSQAGILAWDVNELGTLAVAESSPGGVSSVKIIVPGGGESVVEGTQGEGGVNYHGVFINQAGLVGAVRSLNNVAEVLYAPPGGSAVRVLATGDLLNGVTITDVANPLTNGIISTSAMNEAGQFTIVAAVRIPATQRFIVAIVAPLFPSIASFAPGSGSAGSIVTITGAKFTGATTVAFNDTGATFVVDSPTQIRATVPAGATSGPIVVTTAAGSVTSTQSFTVTVPPAVTTFSPANGPVGSTVTIGGTNLSAATAVAFNGTNATFLVDSATQITATVPIGATSGSISVTSPAGTGTSAIAFSVVLPPTISSLTPSSGEVGTTVTIAGNNLTGASSVKFNGISATFVVNSATQITATVPVGATTGSVTATTVAGTATSAGAFTVTVPPPIPTLTTFSPASGPIGSSVVIGGTNLTGATALAFNGTPAAFTVNSSTQITATVPAGATSGLLAVTTPGGTATSATAFTVTTPVAPAPTIASITPLAGAVGAAVTIKGANFAGATSVMFNGVAASFKLKGGAMISTAVPVGASTGPIVVTTPGGTVQSTDAFVVLPVPTVNSLSPSLGPVGTTVVINGTHFAGTVQVLFNTTSASFSVVSDTTIMAVVPAHAKTGPIAIRQANVQSVASASPTFTVTK